MKIIQFDAVMQVMRVHIFRPLIFILKLYKLDPIGMEYRGNYKHNILREKTTH